MLVVADISIVWQAIERDHQKLNLKTNERNSKSSETGRLKGSITQQGLQLTVWPRQAHNDLHPAAHKSRLLQGGEQRTSRRGVDALRTRQQLDQFRFDSPSTYTRGLAAHNGAAELSDDAAKQSSTNLPKPAVSAISRHVAQELQARGA